MVETPLHEELVKVRSSYMKLVVMKVLMVKECGGVAAWRVVMVEKQLPGSKLVMSVVPLVRVRGGAETLRLVTGWSSW